MLFQFVREALQNDWLPFELRASGGQRLVEDQALALNECGLVSFAGFSILDRFPTARGPPLVGLYCLSAGEGTSKELTAGIPWRRWCGDGWYTLGDILPVCRYRLPC